MIRLIPIINRKLWVSQDCYLYIKENAFQADNPEKPSITDICKPASGDLGLLNRDIAFVYL